MRKVLIVLAISSAVIGVGMFAWKAEATTGTAAAALGAMGKNYSPVQKAACVGWGKHCPPGYRWFCGPYRCWCRPS